MMAKNYSRVLLVTANVGSIFEEPEKMIPVWMQEFSALVKNMEPEFLAIHCQEVGGKNYQDTMQHVNKFIKMLLSLDEMQQFDRARVFLDEDFTAVEKFTALGSLYFIHKSVSSIKIFDFHDAKFVAVEGKEVLSGSIEHVRIKEKAKFAQEFFPDFIWSRKGFIRTRWNLYGTVFDLVNIHLIHDVSNIAAMETSPSTYSDFRVRALLHTIERFENDRYDKVPFLIFGDYNFRLDTHKLVKQLTENAIEQRVMGKKNDVSKVVFKEPDNGKVILTVGKKDFHHHEHNQLFNRHNSMKLKKYDTEPEFCRSKLFEYQVTFPPSYPFSEDTEEATSYMPTRCPGWCDRIMMSHDAPSLFQTDNGFTSDYKMFGMHICMGDHKPIYLNLQLRHNASAASGNNDSKDVTSTSETNVDVDSDSRALIKPLGSLILINGELVDFDSSNIHDFSVFEKEELLGAVFRNGLKHKLPSAALRAKRMTSFRNAVKSIIHGENLLRALKHYSHRSDSEETDEDEESEKTNKHVQVECIVSANEQPIVKSPCDDDVFDTSSTVSSVVVSSDIAESAIIKSLVSDEIQLELTLISPADHVAVGEELCCTESVNGGEQALENSSTVQRLIELANLPADDASIDPLTIHSTEQSIVEELHSTAVIQQADVDNCVDLPASNQNTCGTEQMQALAAPSPEHLSCELSQPSAAVLNTCGTEQMQALAAPSPEHLSCELSQPSAAVLNTCGTEQMQALAAPSPEHLSCELSQPSAAVLNTCGTEQMQALAAPSPEHLSCELSQPSAAVLSENGKVFVGLETSATLAVCSHTECNVNDNSSTVTQQLVDDETPSSDQTVERLCQLGDDVETDRLLPNATVDSLKTPSTPLDADSRCRCC